MGTRISAFVFNVRERTLLTMLNVDTMYKIFVRNVPVVARVVLLYTQTRKKWYVLYLYPGVAPMASEW